MSPVQMRADGVRSAVLVAFVLPAVLTVTPSHRNGPTPGLAGEPAAGPRPAAGAAGNGARP